MSDTLNEIVIAGAGMAGLHAAEALREHGFEGRLTLVGEEPHRPYSRPPLSKEVLTGVGMDPAHGGPGWLVGHRALRLREDAVVEGLDLDFRPNTRAVGLDPAARELRVAGPGGGGSLSYDGLIVATGARARRPGTDLAGVHVLRTLDDAEAIRAAFDSGGHLVVVGAGFVGAEVAASARAVGMEVTLVEAAPTPLTRVVDPRVGEVLTDLHRENGVDVRLGAGVTGFEGAGRVERVRLADGSAIEASLVVAGVGVHLNTEWLRGSGVELFDDGSVVCDEYSATSVPNVYAVGDLANWPHPRYGGRIRLEHWTNASEQGEAAARNLLAGTGRTPFTPVPYFWSDQYKRKVQLLGQGAPADQVAFVHGSPQDRKFVAFLGRGGMLTGVLGLRSTPRTMRYRGLLEKPTTWEEAMAAAGATPSR
ncbi:pyridine nucleotide-disulfide oxidoreductase [Nocardiopsis terrae]|uniref:NADPH-dependent 2,4-dienoyl-CoA reductase/sulfur reductase-like enzyme n=1 Tax=Nocardiopsis terrae TaxID=372655 RepID=A0ABR9HKV9_9ACTN|nr:FAD-dependent oxidoreductase [Nocardiopsis terrae]MBE1459650.1 NADPH-dependent 2,4-dienoyl-CoA reductase/sulfur reductase-like enzyme [Nocardiopsis terrae]GHC94682.1 pyridine nucleotide-disulfide oxidoreductase [Nocardiopsis terrae]